MKINDFFGSIWDFLKNTAVPVLLTGVSTININNASQLSTVQQQQTTAVQTLTTAQQKQIQVLSDIVSSVQVVSQDVKALKAQTSNTSQTSIPQPTTTP